MTTTDQTRLSPGDRVRLVLPHSEVCMHMRVAGTRMLAEVREGGVQLLNPDGSPFSFPILHGEAGVYRDSRGLYAYDVRVPVPMARIRHARTDLCDTCKWDAHDTCPLVDGCSCCAQTMAQQGDAESP
jgi:hypothetical protein